MDKNVFSYPAIFTEENGSYWCQFIDLSGCFSEGNTFEECMENSKEALGSQLEMLENYPKPTMNFSDIKIEENQIISFVSINMNEFRAKYSNKSVKKTLSIPAWLNTMALAQKVNFSQVLQDALMKKLNIDKKHI